MGRGSVLTPFVFWCDWTWPWNSHHPYALVSHAAGGSMFVVSASSPTGPSENAALNKCHTLLMIFSSLRSQNTLIFFHSVTLHQLRLTWGSGLLLFCCLFVKCSFHFSVMLIFTIFCCESLSLYCSRWNIWQETEWYVLLSSVYISNMLTESQKWPIENLCYTKSTPHTNLFIKSMFIIQIPLSSLQCIMGYPFLRRIQHTMMLKSDSFRKKKNHLFTHVSFKICL